MLLKIFKVDKGQKQQTVICDCLMNGFAFAPVEVYLSYGKGKPW